MYETVWGGMKIISSHDDFDSLLSKILRSAQYKYV